MPTNKKTINTYRIEVTAIVEVVASFEVEADTEGEAKLEAEDLLESEIDNAICGINGYEGYGFESLDATVSKSE